MIACEFDHRSPQTLAQLLELLREEPEDAKVLAGGMTLVPMLNLGLAAPARLISLRNVAELSGIVENSTHLIVGAMTRHYVVATDPLIRTHAPLLSLAARLIGDVQVRNRGTVGGSLAHADPAANYLPAVVALNAEFELAGPQGTRSVPAKQFFRDTMTTALDEAEVIVSLRIPKIWAKHGAGFQKFTRVRGNFPIVCAAALADCESDDARVVVGGVTPVPISVDVSGLAADQITAELSSAMAAVEDALLEDQNGDAEYKREMAILFGARAIADARHHRGG